MKFINTDGLSFLGPGSEWFWTALSTLAVILTLAAIYRQVQLQTSVKESQQLGDLSKEWTSERYVRSRLSIWLAIRDGRPLNDLAGTWKVCDFWEDVGSLTRAGHLGKQQLTETLGDDIINWWNILGPTVRIERKARSVPDGYEYFEWLSSLARGDRHDHSYAEGPITPERAEAMIARCREMIALEMELRSAPAPIPTAGFDPADDSLATKSGAEGSG